MRHGWMFVKQIISEDMMKKAEDWKNDGDIFLNKRQYEKALDCYDKAIQLDSNDETAWNSKGIALRNLRRFEEANECYDRAINLNSNNAEIWLNKGSVLGYMLRFEDVISCCEKALEINPKNEEARKQKNNAIMVLNSMNINTSGNNDELMEEALGYFEDEDYMEFEAMSTS